MANVAGEVLQRILERAGCARSAMFSYRYTVHEATDTLQVETALAILEENGHVQSQDGVNPLGRPTVRYYVNPHMKKVAK